MNARTVLFLCTGNYYRSRFAELLFNHHATRLKLNWHADSRGLALDRGSFNIGPISVETARQLTARDVTCPEEHRMPVQCSEDDLAGANLVIALKEDEHRQMLEERYPTWPDRVEYWHVHDLDMASSEQALGEIEQLVDELIVRLRENSSL